MPIFADKAAVDSCLGRKMIWKTRSFAALLIQILLKNWLKASGVLQIHETVGDLLKEISAIIEIQAVKYPHTLVSKPLGSMMAQSTLSSIHA
ncbi:hypothetical protein [Bartonella sp. CB175]|uniref:hypothetical protein n=1 Tax=Bartonella sp. CB175 TaxID=3112256 RepID=UPI00300DF6B8